MTDWCPHHGYFDGLCGRCWREEAWQCYVESGADPNGADARHLNLGEAVAAVRELRKTYELDEDV
jgi:hypothetical protein